MSLYRYGVCVTVDPYNAVPLLISEHGVPFVQSACRDSLELLHPDAGIVVIYEPYRDLVVTCRECGYDVYEGEPYERTRR